MWLPCFGGYGTGVIIEVERIRLLRSHEKSHPGSCSRQGVLGGVGDDESDRTEERANMVEIKDMNLEI